MKTFLYGLLLSARIINGQMITDSQPIEYEDEMRLPDVRTPAPAPAPAPFSDLDYEVVTPVSAPAPAPTPVSDTKPPAPVSDSEVAPDFDEYEICYKQCKIQTPDELTDIDISRIEEGKNVIIDGESVRISEDDEVPLENGDIIRVDGRGKVERVRDGRVVLDTQRGRPQRLTDDQINRLVRGENITLADTKVRFDESRSEIVICGTGRPILTRIDDSLRRGEKIEREDPSLDVVDFEHLADGDVIKHDDQDIRYIDDKVVRVSDWEEVIMSASDSEKMCFHSCTNKAETNPADFYAEFGDTQSSPASIWGMTTATAAILFVR